MNESGIGTQGDCARYFVPDPAPVATVDNCSQRRNPQGSSRLAMRRAPSHLSPDPRRDVWLMSCKEHESELKQTEPNKKALQSEQVESDF